MRTIRPWAGFLLCIAAGMTMGWGYDQSTKGRTWLGPTPEIYPTGSWSDLDAAVPVSSADPTWGARAAPVTVVEFADLTCGHCLELEAVLAQLRDRYGPAQLRVVWKHLPHPQNEEAAQIHASAEAVFRAGGSRAFWEFHAALVGQVAGREPGSASAQAQGAPLEGSAAPNLQERLAQLAAEAGVDRTRYWAELDNPSNINKIREDARLARRLGVRGTPTCFVNGRSVSGAEPSDVFTVEVDQQLEASRELRLRGTPAERIYVALTNANRRPRGTPSLEEELAQLDP